MRIRNPLGVVLVGLALAGCTNPGARDITDVDRKAFNDIRTQEMAAYTSGDAEKLASMMTDDAAIMPPNERMLTGKDAVREYVRVGHEQFTMSGEYQSADVVAASGDTAVERMTFKLTLQPKTGGAPIVDQGKGVHVYRRQADGTWKVSLDIWNSDAPAEGGATSTAAADPIIGTWELNVAKSRYVPGPPPKAETRIYVADGPNIRATSKTIEADGRVTPTSWTINYDGQDRPITGLPDADALSLRRVNAGTTEFTQKKGGRIVITGTRVISPDGKVMTITTKGTNAKGQTVDTLEVYEKR